jgi:hypothetical protein
MGESQPWLELDSAPRKRLPRPLNLCQFLTLPIGEYYQHRVTGGPPEKAGDSEACRGSSKPAAVRQRVLRCWEDRILQRTTADSASGEREDAKGIVAKCSCLPKSSPTWVCSSDGLIFHVLPGVFQGSLRGSPAAGGDLERRFHRTPEPAHLRNVGHDDSVQSVFIGSLD